VARIPQLEGGVVLQSLGQQPCGRWCGRVSDVEPGERAIAAVEAVQEFHPRPGRRHWSSGSSSACFFGHRAVATADAVHQSCATRDYFGVLSSGELAAVNRASTLATVAGARRSRR
jgi:hypothetical protein